MKYIITALLLFASGLSYGQAGYLDKTFGNGGEVILLSTEPGLYPADIKVLPDGKIIHSGSMTRWEDTTTLYIMKHHADGTIDSGFGDQGYVTYKMAHNFSGGPLLVYPDGRILVFGSQKDKGQVYGKPMIMRFLPNGSIDTSFGSGGKYDGSGFTRGSSFMRLQLMADGSLVALGGMSRVDSNSRQQDPMITRITSEGKNDPSFGTDGTLVIPAEKYTAVINAALFYPEDKYIFSYTSYISGKPHLTMLRTDTDGIKDSSFGSNGTVSMQLSDVETFTSYFAENSGKEILSLVQRNVAIAPKSLLMRFLPDGRIDETFGNWGAAKNIDSTDNRYFSQCTLDSNNSIIVAGQRTDGFLTIGSILARYHRDGVVDSSFGVAGVGYGVPDAVALIGVAVQSDGKYVALGLHIGDAVGNYVALYRFHNTGTARVDRSPASSSSISLHPTPSTNNCTVTYTLPSSSNCTMTLRDESGREVRTFTTNEHRTTGEHKEELDLHGLAAGVYFVQIESGGTIQTAKLIKQ
jgi:uncharacterized delta-60 repeat protein